MSLRHYLSLSGYTTKPVITTLTPDNEYRFVELMMRFIHDLDSDIKLKRCSYKTGICEYIGKNASTIIGGRKEKVEEELNRIVNMLDFSLQSEQIGLYNWIVERNFGIRILGLHNKILAKLRTLDSDLMLNKQRNLQKSTHIFKDVVDLVGKFLNKKGVEIFVEKVELAEGHKRGGFRDRKVSAVLTLKAALHAAYEVDSTEGTDGNRGNTVERDNSRGSKRSVDGYSTVKKVSVNQLDKPSDSSSKRQLEHDQADHKYTLHRKQAQEESVETVVEDFSLDDIREVSKEKRQTMNVLDMQPDGRNGSKSKDDKVSSRKVAHRYFFGDTKSLEDAKVEERKLNKGTPADQLAELDKKHEEAISKNMELEELWAIAIRNFNQAKKNYNNLGKETQHCHKLAGFLRAQFPTDRDTVKVCKEVEGNDVPETKKVKLAIGKILEKASQEIIFEQDRIFKFSLDKDDYDNQPFKNQHDVAYDLVEKDPTDTTKGVKNARNELRDNKDIRASSPLAGKQAGQDYGEDDEDLVLIKRSAFYDPRDLARRQKSQGLDAYEKEIGSFKIDERIMQGMGSVILQKFLAESINPKSKRKRTDDGDYDEDVSSQTGFTGSNNLSVDEILRKTVAMNKKFDLKDFENGLGPNYIEFDAREGDDGRKGFEESAVFDRDRTKKAQAEFSKKSTRIAKPQAKMTGRPIFESAKDVEPWARQSRSPTRSPTRSRSRGSKSPGKANGSTGRYVLYEDEDPAFGIYTNVRLDKNQAQTTRRVGKFLA